MADSPNIDVQMLRLKLIAVLARFSADATGARPIEEVADEWFDAGFDDAEEVEDWLRARGVEATGARALCEGRPRFAQS